MGTPDFAVATLQALVDGGYNVVAVVTQPDKPVGRHQDHLQPSAVKQYALANNLPVLQPVKMKDPDFVEQLRSFGADLQVVVAFRMLPEVVWSMPRFGTFNVHASLLPQYRGAAPINWAIINGETETGVTTFFLDHNIDTGSIILQHPMPIPSDADVADIYDKLKVLGAKAAIETTDRLIAGDGHITSIPQPAAEELKPAPKIFKETCQIDWNKTTLQAYNFIRGLSPVPGSWTTLLVNGHATTIKIFRSAVTSEQATAAPGTVLSQGRKLFIACKDTWLEITELQMAGKRRMAAADFLNGIKTIERV